MSLLLSQLTPVADTGPVGTGVNCLVYEFDEGFIENDSSFWFLILPDDVFPDTGPIGTGVYCIETETYNEDGSIDESFIFFISEDFIPPVVSVVFLRPSRIYYAT